MAIVLTHSIQSNSERLIDSTDMGMVFLWTVIWEYSEARISSTVLLSLRVPTVAFPSSDYTPLKLGHWIQWVIIDPLLMLIWF